MKKKRNWLYVMILLLAMSMCGLTVCAKEADEDEDVTLAPYFFVEGADPSTDRLPLKATDVETTVNGMIAETYVTQTYANEGRHPINARYVFPASTQVTVHGMTMEIADQIVTAQIREKEEAKEVFEQAKSEGKSASLMEEKRPNVFTLDVANIMPGDTIRIKLHYTEMITPTEGVYQFVFPTVTGPRYASPKPADEAEEDDWVETPYLEEGSNPEGTYNITVNLSTGVPITDLECGTHETSVEWNGKSMAKVTLSNTDDYAGDRDFILEYRLTGEKLSSGLMLYEGEEENFFQLTMQPPKRYDAEDVPAREYIFVLDVSGSMNGYPLDTAKELIRNLVKNLKKTDRFNVILFSDIVSEMSLEPVSATEVNIDCAMKLIDMQEGGGGTELCEALQCAVDNPKREEAARSIVVITDGYISDEEEIFELIGEHMDTASFFPFGIGSSVNRYLMEGIAGTGMGESFIVTDAAEAEETAERFRTYIEAPLLTDIRLDFDGFDVYEVEPAKISTLYAEKPIVVFGKWKGEPSGTIRISGRTGTKDYAETVHVSEAEPAEENGVIRYLWARKRLETLTDYGFRKFDKSIKAEVTALGLNYSMITPYTSFVAVLDTVRNTEGESTDVDQPSPLPAGVSNLAVGGYLIGAEPSDILLLGMMGIVLLLGIGFRKRRGKGAGI